MTSKHIIENYLKEDNYNLKKDYQGITLNINNKELLIKGKQIDLIELADYILDIALSEEKDHLHLDNLTIINNNSNIKELIIEKE